MLVQKLMEIEDEKKENELVLESISKLEERYKGFTIQKLMHSSTISSNPNFLN